jgi:hypothetical protein
MIDGMLLFLLIGEVFEILSELIKSSKDLQQEF